MHADVYREKELGLRLIEWLEPYPVDLTADTKASPDDMPALISIGDGRLRFNVDLGSLGGACTVVCHDIGHFLTVPRANLAKANIGLSTKAFADFDLGPGKPETIAEEDAMALQVVLIRHLCPDYSPQIIDNLIRISSTIFRATKGAIQAKIAAATYEEILAEWEARMELVRATEAPSLEDSLLALLG